MYCILAVYTTYFLLFTSTLLLLILYLTSTISLQVTFRHPTVLRLFPPWERFIPTVGMFHSQRGNILFPTWESQIALMETTPHLLSGI